MLTDVLPHVGDRKAKADPTQLFNNRPHQACFLCCCQRKISTHVVISLFPMCNKWSLEKYYLIQKRLYQSNYILMRAGAEQRSGPISLGCTSIKITQVILCLTNVSFVKTVKAVLILISWWDTNLQIYAVKPAETSKLLASRQSLNIVNRGWAH